MIASNKNHSGTFSLPHTLLLILMFAFSLTISGCTFGVQDSGGGLIVADDGSVVLNVNASPASVQLSGYWGVSDATVELKCLDSNNALLVVGSTQVVETLYTVGPASDMGQCADFSDSKGSYKKLFVTVGNSFIPVLTQSNLGCIIETTKKTDNLVNASNLCLQKDGRVSASIFGINTSAQEINLLKVYTELDGGLTQHVTWTASSTEKIKQGQSPSEAAPRVRLAAARNEYESAQVVVHAESGLQDIDMSMSNLTGPGGAVIPPGAWNIYRVNYVNCEDKGLLPDSMVPFVDPMSGQRIGGEYGAPFDVEAGKNVPVWLELHVPTNAKPGVYTGEVTVSQYGKALDIVPVEVTVWPITIPKTTQLKTYFSLNWNKHPQRAYLHSLHEHRIDIWFIKPMNDKGGHRLLKDRHGNFTTMEWERETEANMNAYFDGSMFKDGVPGKTYLFGYGMDNLIRILQTDEQGRIMIFKEFERRYGHKPWAKNTAWFIVDEPKPENMETVEQIGRNIKQHSPNIGFLLTTRYQEKLKGLVTLWDPIINREVIEYGAPGPEPYREEIRAGRSVINAITVNSNISTSPNLFINHSGMNTRIWTWATWMLGHDGIEFWQTKPAPSVTTPKKYGKAWGDGSLFYRGLPSELGIPKEIALPSLRLKMLRDGIEDYELLSMLRKKNPAEADRIGRMMAQDLAHYDDSYAQPIKYVKDFWSPDGLSDVRKAPGRLVWEASHERLNAARGAIAKALTQ